MSTRMTPRSLYFQPVLLIFILLFLVNGLTVLSAPSLSDGLVQNITRLDKGDAFFVAGGECGVTRCGEVSGGTALSDRPPGGMGGCSCRCRNGLPLYREDKALCVEQVAECPMAHFGAGEGATNVPLVFLPLPGQIIHPSKEIHFTDVEKTVCAVSSAQYLSRTGWGSLRENLDNDVPFSLYRDEGRTYLLWRGSEDMRSRVTGRVVIVKLACRSNHHLLLPCVAFKVQGTPPDLPSEIPAVYFSREDLFPPPPKSHVASLSTMLLLCALVGTLIYAGAIVLYVRHKRQNSLTIEDKKNDETEISDMPNTTTNPLLSLSSFFTDSRTSSCEMLTDKDESPRSFSSHSSSMADSLERQNQLDIDDREIDSDSKSNTCQIICNEGTLPSVPVVCMPVLVERRPELHVNIVEDLEPNYKLEKPCHVPLFGNIRKKLYFNPAYLEPHMLKQPPPAAVEFLTKIREVITIAKDKMLSKRFTPHLPAIMEERFCFEVDLALNCEFFKNKLTAASLKRENSRRKSHCSGCPGCRNVKIKDIFHKTLSEKEYCKSCTVSELKDTIVRKWLDGIPIIETVTENENVRERSIKFQGIPKSIQPIHLNNDDGTRKSLKKDKIAIEGIKEKLGPPPLPPIRTSSISEKSDVKIKEQKEEERPKLIIKKKDDDILNIPSAISPELKKKMNAVINELSKFRRIEPITPRAPSPVAEVATPFIPKLVIPIIPKVVKNPGELKTTEGKRENGRKANGKIFDYEVDSLERSNLQKYLKPVSGEHRLSNNKKRASIIPMDKLEPMKRIQEMNSRLSKNIGSKDHNNNTQESPTKCKSYTIQRSNLVSEVYINDYINTMSSTSDSEYSSPNSSIIHIGDTPTSTPSQLVIEVESIPGKKTALEEQCFDPDTLDRKADKLGKGPIIKPKNIDHIFLKSPSSFKEETFNFPDNSWVGNANSGQNNSNDSGINVNNSKTVDNRCLVNSNNVIFYENCVFNSYNNVLYSGSRSLSEIFLEKKEEIKPPLPPKKVIGKNKIWNNYNNATKIIINGGDNIYNSSQQRNKTYRICRSEPPQMNTFIDKDEKPIFHRPLILEVKEEKTFPSIGTNMKEKVQFLSLDPNYDSYSTYEYKKQDTTNIENKGIDNRKLNKRSAKYRNKLLSMHSKTEDSGYLSSDSNESKQKSKFILQVRDKDGEIKNGTSDTDDLESIGDARSESGAESIETNSVFFGSLRTLSSIRKAQELDKNKSGKGDLLNINGIKPNTTDECKELRSIATISSPKERLAALDDL